MIVIDVNVLVAAFIADHVHHGRAFAFLTRALRDDSVIVPDAVSSGFLRIVTNPRIITPAVPTADALAFIRAVTAAPGYRGVAGLVDGIEPFLQTCAAGEASGNLVPDAYIASVAAANGCAVATFDRDFRRFDGLHTVAP